MRDFESNIPYELKNEYRISYKNKTSKLKKDAYDKGYVQALSSEKKDFSNYKNDDEIESYKDGYDSGMISLDDEGKNAYDYGFNGEEYTVPDEFSVAENALLLSYKKDSEELLLKKEKQAKVTTITIGILLVVGVGGVKLIRKKRKISSDDELNV